MSEVILFLLGWFIGLTNGVAISLKTAMENKLKEKNERKKYEELKLKFENKK